VQLVRDVTLVDAAVVDMVVQGPRGEAGIRAGRCLVVAVAGGILQDSPLVPGRDDAAGEIAGIDDDEVVQPDAIGRVVVVVVRDGTVGVAQVTLIDEVRFDPGDPAVCTRWRQEELRTGERPVVAGDGIEQRRLWPDPSCRRGISGLWPRQPAAFAQGEHEQQSDEGCGEDGYSLHGLIPPLASLGCSTIVPNANGKVTSQEASLERLR